MQRRAGQLRDRRLEHAEAVIELQVRVMAKGDNDRLVLWRHHRRTRNPQSRALVGNRGPLPPLGNRLRIDPVALRVCPQARLTILDRLTDRFCRCWRCREEPGPELRPPTPMRRLSRHTL